MTCTSLSKGIDKNYSLPVPVQPAPVVGPVQGEAGKWKLHMNSRLLHASIQAIDRHARPLQLSARAQGGAPAQGKEHGEAPRQDWRGFPYRYYPARPCTMSSAALSATTGTMNGATVKPPTARNQKMWNPSMSPVALASSLHSPWCR